MEAALVAALAAALWGTGAGLLPYVNGFLAGHRLTAVNYRGEPLPVGSGLLLLGLQAVWLLLLVVVGWRFPALGDIGGGSVLSYAGYTAAVLIVGGAGWLDDTVGDRTVKGWKGHWRRLTRDKVLTTGVIKAAGTGVAAWIAAGAAALERTEAGGRLGLGVDLQAWPELALQVALLLLMTNALNLLDLRPGRCIKSFLGLCAVLLIALMAGGATRAGLLAPALALLPAVAGALVLLPGDLGARHMLGDTGANVLGFAAGYALIGSLPAWGQAAAVVLLLALHAYAETHSISAWIERHRLIRLLDRWGRA